jgi:hypothetical protein
MGCSSLLHGNPERATMGLRVNILDISMDVDAMVVRSATFNAPGDASAASRLGQITLSMSTEVSCALGNSGEHAELPSCGVDDIRRTGVMCLDDWPFVKTSIFLISSKGQQGRQIDTKATQHSLVSGSGSKKTGLFSNRQRSNEKPLTNPKLWVALPTPCLTWQLARQSRANDRARG